MGNRSMTILEQLSASDAQVILDRLPERIRMALLDDLRSVVDHRATEIEYPIERVVEMAIASFLDAEALGFADCRPGRGQ
jgi:predicted transcriptional regulator